MKFLVAFSCFLAIAAAKPSHAGLDVAWPHLGLGKLGYSYSTIGTYPSVISSPVLAYNAIPALSHHAFTYSVPSIAYKTEQASSIVGHKTAVAQQDNTVHHGAAVVQEVAPVIEAKTIHTEPALSHQALAFKTIPSVSYKTEHASSIVGHKTAVAHQDNTVHHGAKVVQEVAPAVAIKTIHATPIIHEVPQVLSYYSSAPVVSHSVITHKATPLFGYKTEIATPVINQDIVQEVAPAVEVKSKSIVENDAVITDAAPLVKTEIPAAPVYRQDTTVVHPTAYTSVVRHETPIIGYKTDIVHPVISHAALASHKFIGFPTAYSVAHHSSVGVPVALAHHGIVAAPGAIATHLAVDKTQYHAQDIVGQATYGHSEALQHHHATQDAAGNKIGSYGWVAPNGQVVGGQYVADALGYRVSSNAIPQGPAPVLDTPEVVAARSAHFAAHAAARALGPAPVLDTPEVVAARSAHFAAHAAARAQHFV